MCLMDGLEQYSQRPVGSLATRPPIKTILRPVGIQSRQSPAATTTSRHPFSHPAEESLKSPTPPSTNPH